MSYPYRLQIESANRLARNFADATADEHMQDLRRVVGNAVTALEDLLDERFCPGWISDALAGLIDDVSDKMARINRELDDAGAEARTFDDSDLRALHFRATEAWRKGGK